MSDDDDARYDAEGYLRGHKPNPVNAACKQRIEELHSRIQKPRPQHWSNQPSEYNRPPREHGEHRTIEQPHEDGSDAVQNQGDRETVFMKRIQLGGSELKRFRVNSSGKQVDGIPDASGFEQPVGTGQHSHRYRSRQATLYASRYRVGFEGKPCTHEVGSNRYTLDNATFGCDAMLFEYDGHRFLMLVGKHFTEPADATRHSQDDAQGTHRHAREKTCEHQGETESQNKRPRG